MIPRIPKYMVVLRALAEGHEVQFPELGTLVMHTNENENLVQWKLEKIGEYEGGGFVDYVDSLNDFIELCRGLSDEEVTTLAANVALSRSKPLSVHASDVDTSQHSVDNAWQLVRKKERTSETKRSYQGPGVPVTEIEGQLRQEYLSKVPTTKDFLQPSGSTLDINIPQALQHLGIPYTSNTSIPKDVVVEIQACLEERLGTAFWIKGDKNGNGVYPADYSIYIEASDRDGSNSSRRFISARNMETLHLLQVQSQKS